MADLKSGTLGLDTLTRIMNVQWEGGLAVEFTGRPSYLTLDLTAHPLNLNKATVSVWFRIPQATADAIEFFATTPDFKVFDGVIPILVLGKQKQGTVTNWEWTTVGYTFGPDDPPFYLGGPPTSPVQSTLASGSHQGALAPTFIGVDKDGWIAVHIQTGDIGIPNQLGLTLSEYELIFTPSDPGFFTVRLETTYIDQTAQQFTYPDSLGNDGLPTDGGRPDFNGFKVTFDKWHHLLLSWDIKAQNASHGYTFSSERESAKPYVTETSTLYCAIDDVNKNGDDLPGLRMDGMGLNETISYGTERVAGMSNLSGAPVAGPPSYSVAFSNGVVADALSIPAAPEYQLTYPPYSGAGPDNSDGVPIVHPNALVEMAELQIFAGLMLDTSIASNRRAFIDFERDANGVQVGNTLKPVNPSKTEELLHRRADVILHGTSKWQRGKNTGAIGIEIGEDGDEHEKPAGQFTPTGEIKKYKPDPTIET